MESERQVIRIQRLPGHDLHLPRYMTAGSAGMDLCAAEAALIAAGEWKAIGCGFSVALPEGCEGQVRPRSGLALRHGVTVLNAPGTIDSDYRGEVRVILINHGKSDFEVRRGDRIAQLIVAPVCRAELHETDELPPTPRGARGFGHTG